MPVRAWMEKGSVKREQIKYGLCGRLHRDQLNGSMNLIILLLLLLLPHVEKYTPPSPWPCVLMRKPPSRMKGATAGTV